MTFEKLVYFTIAKNMLFVTVNKYIYTKYVVILLAVIKQYSLGRDKQFQLNEVSLI